MVRTDDDDVLRGGLNTARAKMGCQGWISFGFASAHAPPATGLARFVVRTTAAGRNHEGNDNDVPGSDTLPAQLPNSGWHPQLIWQ